MTTQRKAAHHADLAQALLRALGITDETPDYYDRTVGEIRAALQASAPSSPTGEPSPAAEPPYDEFPPGHLLHRAAADRIEEARRDLWARIGGAAAEGSEPLDVATAWKAGFWKGREDDEWLIQDDEIDQLAAAYASQTSEGTE